MAKVKKQLMPLAVMVEFQDRVMVQVQVEIHYHHVTILFKEMTHPKDTNFYGNPKLFNLILRYYKVVATQKH